MSGLPNAKLTTIVARIFTVVRMPSEFDSLEFYALLNAGERAVFQRATTIIPVAKKELVINQDTPGGDVYFVLEGSLEVTVYSGVRGRNVFYRTLGPGDVFGELAAIDGQSRTATVTAQSKGRIVRLSAADFRGLIESSARAAMWLVRRHTAQVRALTARLFEQIALAVVTRVRLEIIRLADEAGVADNRAEIKPFYRHQQVAEKVGTTREAVTRELGVLKAKRLIDMTRGRLVILDYAGLKKLLTV